MDWSFLFGELLVRFNGTTTNWVPLYSALVVAGLTCIVGSVGGFFLARWRYHHQNEEMRKSVSDYSDRYNRVREEFDDYIREHELAHVGDIQPLNAGDALEGKEQVRGL